MTTLLLVRHGFSTSNEKGTITGQLDEPLTPLGVLQGEAASRYIAEHYSVDAIYSSDLSRAMDTVRPLAAHTGLPILAEENLRELDCGDWSGKLVSALLEQYGDRYRAWTDSSDEGTPPHGEGWSALSQRIYDAVRKIAEENEGKTVVVATHGGAIKAFRGKFLGIPASEWRHRLPFATNASVTEIVYEKGRFRECASIDEYLGSLRTEMPKGI